MSQVRVHNFSVSLDGFGTGIGQSVDAPFGHAGSRLHEWFFATRTFRAMHGESGGTTGIDDALHVGAGHRRRNHGSPQVRAAARPMEQPR